MLATGVPWKTSLRLLLLVAVWPMLVGTAVAQARPMVRVMPQVGHSSSVTSVAFSPDGHSVLSGSDEGTIKLWDTATGKLLRTFQGRQDGVTSVAFSPDGRSALSGSLDKSLKVWDVATGSLLRTLQGHSEYVTSVAFSPNGRTAISGSGDGALKLWDVTLGKAVRTFRAYSESVNAVAFSPDGRTALSLGRHRFPESDANVKLWDVVTGRLLRTFEGHSAGLTSVAFSPDGRSAFVGSSGGPPYLWDVATGRLLRAFEGHPNWVWAYSVAFSPDGRSALSANSDKVLRLWDVVTGRLLRTFEGHSADVTSVAFSPDGRTALSGSKDATLRLWDVATGKLSRTFQGKSEPVRSVAFAPDGRSALSGSYDKTLKLWDIARGRLLRTLEGASFVNSVVFSPNGHAALSGSDDRTLKLWDVATGRLLRSFEGHSGWVRSVAFSPDGRTALSGSDDRTLKLWDVATGRQLRTFQGHSGTVTSVAYSPDGRSALSGSSDKTLKLWDVVTGKLLRSFEGHSGWVRSVAFAPDGRTVLSGGEPAWRVSDATLKLWDVATGRLLHAFGGRDHVTSIAFSPDGRTALSGSGDGALKLWDVATGKHLRTLAVHSTSVNSVTFSPDGRSALSGTGDGLVDLWSTSNGREVLKMMANDKGDWLTRTPDGFFDFGGDIERMVHLVRGLEVLSIGQTFEHLHRPDLIQELLRGDLEGKYKDAAYHLSLDTLLESGSAPQIEHLAEKDDRAGDSIRLSVRITGRGGGVGSRISWRVNGITQGHPTPSVLGSLASPLASVVVTETLKLVPGQLNLVEIVAYNRAGLVATPPLKITIDKFGATTIARPRMFVLALGVDKYRMNEYRLSYAAYDARTLAKALEVVGSGLFSEVKARALTDALVSEAGISTAIEEIAGDARPEDVFVLFLGGHGKSIAGRYYYYPQTLDFTAGHTVEQHGIGQDKWEAWLARLPMQKSLLVIDTCEGDAFRGSRGTDAARQAAMAQLQHATGRNIIAASRNAAYEGYRGHGVLTYAILEALDNKAGPRSDDRVRVAALAEYVGIRVPEISQKSFGIYQNPTRKLTGNDFPIGIRGAVLEASRGGPTIPKEPTHVLIRAELLRERPAADAQGIRTLTPGTQVRAVEFVGAWVIVARDGQKLGYVPVEALVRLQ